MIIDWGDSCVGHPFGTMLATLNSIAFHHKLAPDDPAFGLVVDAYTDAWTDLHDRPTLRRLVSLAQRVGPLTRSLSYRQALVNVDEPAWQEYGDSMPEWLLEVFEPDLPRGRQGLRMVLPRPRGRSPGDPHRRRRPLRRRRG